MLERRSESSNLRAQLPMPTRTAGLPDSVQCCFRSTAAPIRHMMFTAFAARRTEAVGVRPSGDIPLQSGQQPHQRRRCYDDAVGLS